MGRRVVAWVVAAVVTVGLVAGGVLVARSGRERPPAVLPALDLGAAGQASAGSDRATGATEPAPAVEPARRGVAPARPYDTGDLPQPWPPVTYKLGGALPTLPDRARAWKLGDTVDAGRVASLAAALGLAGQPRQEATGWTVRDGRRALVVHKLPGAAWTFGTGILGGCGTRSGGPYRPGGGVECLNPDAPVSNQPVAPAKPSRPPALPTRAEAERVARELATRAGLDLDAAQVRVTDSYATRTVTIAPAVGGSPTSGFAWTVGVDGQGAVRYASGYLATPEQADSYPLIGVREGFERLKKVSPLGPLARAEAPAIARDPWCPAGAKVPCPAKPLRARVATVTGARLGLQLAPAVAKGGRPAGVAYLLPAYLFDLEGGWTEVRAIVAVPDRYLTGP